ncbi:MAG: MATE family efflux transporter [Lachnospiraceae bacterium]|nr:MATE family efflux transporter [Lachnospiraceae bacterium]
MRKKEVNMLSGPIAKGLLTIAFPIMVMNVLTSLFNVIDMTILKSFGSNELAVGAVGTCSTLISMISGLLIGVSAGANVVVAKYIGKGNQERVDRSVGTAIALALGGGLLLLLIGVSFAKVFLQWTNCPDELLSQATLYFRLYFAGTPILMVYTFAAAILRSSGDSRRPMLYSVLGGVVKVIGTFLFVAVFKMSVEGVAFATIISWSASAILAFRALLKNEGVVKLKTERIRFYRQEMGEILFIGIPAGLQQALYSVANVIITATVNSFGAAATTGISIANNFDGILYQISVSPALAVMPYVSQNVGVGNIKRATQAVGRGMLITIGFGATFGALSAIFSAQLSSIMSSDPAVIAYSQQKMVIISSTYFICGINEIMGAAMKGMGKPIVATAATLIFMCAIRFVWVYLIFPLCPNLTFLYLIWPIGWILSITMLLIFYFPTVKKLSALCAKSATQN